MAYHEAITHIQAMANERVEKAEFEKAEEVPRWSKRALDIEQGNKNLKAALGSADKHTQDLESLRKRISQFKERARAHSKEITEAKDCDHERLKSLELLQGQFQETQRALESARGIAVSYRACTISCLLTTGKLHVDSASCMNNISPRRLLKRTSTMDSMIW